MYFAFIVLAYVVSTQHKHHNLEFFSSHLLTLFKINKQVIQTFQQWGKNNYSHLWIWVTQLMHLKWCLLCELLPPGIPARGAAFPDCISNWWLSSCGRGGPSGSHLGYQHRSGRCALLHLGDPDSSGWCLCSSKQLLEKENMETSVNTGSEFANMYTNWSEISVSFILHIHSCVDISPIIFMQVYSVITIT